MAPVETEGKRGAPFKRKNMKTDNELRLEELEYAAKSGDRESFDGDEILFLLQRIHELESRINCLKR